MASQRSRSAHQQLCGPQEGRGHSWCPGTHLAGFSCNAFAPPLVGGQEASLLFQPGNKTWTEGSIESTSPSLPLGREAPEFPRGGGGRQGPPRASLRTTIRSSQNGEPKPRAFMKRRLYTTERFRDDSVCQSWSRGQVKPSRSRKGSCPIVQLSEPCWTQRYQVLKIDTSSYLGTFCCCLCNVRSSASTVAVS